MKTLLESKIAIKILTNDIFSITNHSVKTNSYERNICTVIVNDALFYGSKATIENNVIYMYP